MATSSRATIFPATTSTNFRWNLLTWSRADAESYAKPFLMFLPYYLNFNRTIAGVPRVGVLVATLAVEQFDDLRAIKTPYEQKVLTRSVEISAEAHIEGMKATRPGIWNGTRTGLPGQLRPRRGLVLVQLLRIAVSMR